MWFIGGYFVLMILLFGILSLWDDGGPAAGR